MPTNHILRRAGVLLSFVALVSLIAVSAFATDHAKPTVAIIKAEWCQACQKLEPTMMELMKQYQDRVNFVVLDVTNDKKTAASAATARKLGIGKLFEAHKQKTSTVLVLDAKHQVLFQTMKNFDRDAYVKAFDEAIAKTSKQS